jgi:hypothetical protein
MREIPKNYPPFITQDNVEEFDVHKFSVEASELGLRVGDWPVELKTSLGNEMPFLMIGHNLTPSGDLAGVKYMQANGCISLLIIND